MAEAPKHAALGSPSANPFAVSYLQLCQISHADPSQIPALAAQVTPLGDGHCGVAAGVRPPTPTTRIWSMSRSMPTPRPA